MTGSVYFHRRLVLTMIGAQHFQLAFKLDSPPPSTLALESGLL
jgi:hypothetical protein